MQKLIAENAKLLWSQACFALLKRGVTFGWSPELWRRISRTHYTDEKSAWHEAGHALVTCHSQFRDDLAEVSLDSGRSGGGGCHVEFPYTITTRPDAAKDYLRILFAGQVAAEEQAGCRLRHYGTDSDNEKIQRTLKSMFAGQASAVAKECKADARRLLQENRAGLQALAEALLEKRRLVKHQVLEILEPRVA